MDLGKLRNPARGRNEWSNLPNYLIGMNDQKKYPHINLMPYQWEPFNGDTHLQDEFIRLRDKHGIKKAIELGTCLGSTTIFLAENFEQVYSTEISPEFYAIADARLIDRNLWNVALY